MVQCADDLLTYEEIAQRARVKVSTVRGWARSGLIPSVRISPKIVRFDWLAVRAAIAGAVMGEVAVA
jgi:excisionase family DNA binding protein